MNRAVRSGVRWTSSLWSTCATRTTSSPSSVLRVERFRVTTFRMAPVRAISGQHQTKQQEQQQQQEQQRQGQEQQGQVQEDEQQPPPQEVHHEQGQMSTGAKLRALVSQYGSTVMVFHVSMSLTWLGLTYWAVSSGLDVPHYLEVVGLAPDTLVGTAGAGAGTFVVAYACYKVFAPVRMAITAGTVPFLVRYLRRVGVMKKVA